MKDIIAEHKTAGIIGNMVGSDHQRLGQPFGPWLRGIADIHPVIAPITKQASERRQIVGE